MNERIKELISQSYETVENEYGRSVTFFNKEKFAELIVRECLDISTDVENEALQNKEYKAGSVATLIKTLIKDKFGVES